MTHPLRWLALVPLERADMAAIDNVAAWYKEHFPSAPQPAPSGTTDKLLTLTLGEYTAAATLVDRPIPWSQLEGPCATAWYWPEAAETLRRHMAHLLVTLVDEGGRAVTKAACLTRLTAALTATSPSLGVFWGPSRMVHPSDAFIEQAAPMRDDDLPLFLWIDFRIEAFGDGAVRLYTTGLEGLGQSELEVSHYVGPPQQLLGYAYNIAHYLLDQRKVVRDGDTIGLTDDVQVAAHRGPSMIDPSLEVLKLEFVAGG